MLVRKNRISQGDSKGLQIPALVLKIFLPFFVKICLCSPIPHPREGRFAIVTSVGRGMRWTLAARATSAAGADCQVVWSWRPLAGAKSADDDLQATVTKRSWTPGRARSSVNTIAQGMPMFRLHLR